MYESEESNIIKNWSEEVVVSISCICFNQINYIEETLIGFLKQKTTFRFEILIHDDASSDGTTELIRQYEIKYPHIIKPLYEIENQWSKGRRGSIVFNIPRAKGKYIALCEGDDYWIDPNKLQKQVDFLEENPEYGMCYTRTMRFEQKKQHFLGQFGSEFGSFEDLLINGNRIPTLTVCFRQELVEKYILDVKPETKGWLMGDYPMWLWMAHETKIKFLPVSTTVYRILEESASNTQNLQKKIDFIQSGYDIQRYFMDKYNIVYESLESEKRLTLATYAFLSREKILGKKYLSEVNYLNRYKGKIKFFILKNPIMRFFYLKRIRPL